MDDRALADRLVNYADALAVATMMAAGRDPACGV